MPAEQETARIIPMHARRRPLVGGVGRFNTILRMLRARARVTDLEARLARVECWAKDKADTMAEYGEAGAVSEQDLAELLHILVEPGPSPEKGGPQAA